MTGEADPFDTLGLEARFDLDRAEIERAYLSRVASAHPDRGGEAHTTAASLNKARKTLLDAERRAGALLARLGGPSSSADTSLPDGFLMEIMEVRTAIEESLAGGAGTAREDWQAWADERRAGHIGRIGPMFERALAGDSGVLSGIRRELNAWRYIERLIEQLDPEYDPARADFGG